MSAERVFRLCVRGVRERARQATQKDTHDTPRTSNFQMIRYIYMHRRGVGVWVHVGHHTTENRVGLSCLTAACPLASPKTLYYTARRRVCLC